jgi:hypothetical protein
VPPLTVTDDSKIGILAILLFLATVASKLEYWLLADLVAELALGSAAPLMITEPSSILNIVTMLVSVDPKACDKAKRKEK